MLFYYWTDCGNIRNVSWSENKHTKNIVRLVPTDLWHSSDFGNHLFKNFQNIVSFELYLQ